MLVALGSVITVLVFSSCADLSYGGAGQFSSVEVHQGFSNQGFVNQGFLPQHNHLAPRPVFIQQPTFCPQPIFVGRGGRLDQRLGGHQQSQNHGWNEQPQNQGSPRGQRSGQRPQVQDRPSRGGEQPPSDPAGMTMASYPTAPSAPEPVMIAPEQPSPRPEPSYNPEPAPDRGGRGMGGGAGPDLAPPPSGDSAADGPVRNPRGR